MDLQTRKIAFVQEFLDIQNEEAISQFENLLKKSKKADITIAKKLKPISIKEFNQRIDSSENDFKNNQFTTSEQLLSKY